MSQVIQNGSRRLLRQHAEMFGFTIRWPSKHIPPRELQEEHELFMAIGNLLCNPLIRLLPHPTNGIAARCKHPALRKMDHGGRGAAHDSSEKAVHGVWHSVAWSSIMACYEFGEVVALPWQPMITVIAGRVVMDRMKDPLFRGGFVLCEVGEAASEREHGQIRIEPTSEGHEDTGKSLGILAWELRKKGMREVIDHTDIGDQVASSGA